MKQQLGYHTLESDLAFRARILGEKHDPYYALTYKKDQELDNYAWITHRMQRRLVFVPGK